VGGPNVQNVLETLSSSVVGLFNVYHKMRM